MTIYEELFKSYADRLVKDQIVSENKAFHGGIPCLACKVIHGRCIDAVYALSVAYKRYGDDKYLICAKRLMEYADNLICTDGGIYNDVQTEWIFTTAFHVIALVHTLNDAGSVLPIDFKVDLERRTAFHANWLYNKLDENSPVNINYVAANALALFLAGSYLKEDKYLKQAKHLGDYAKNYVSESDLFFGECQPHNTRTKKGCLGIDIGYNMEETLPALVEYTDLSKDEELMTLLLKAVNGHLKFILPDGAIDNSFGCRNYKWTYYGSRTCDGASPMFLTLAKYNGAFVEASYRNTVLLSKCTHDGYLYGGPDYLKHNEHPCIHHTFEHINALTYSIEHFDESLLASNNELIPTDKEYAYYIKEMDSYRLSNKNYLLDITNYDMNIPYSGHATGGAISMLYSRKLGPMIMGSVGDYKLTESTNMQTPLDRDNHKCLLPRVEKIVNRWAYSTIYYLESKINKLEEGHFEFESGLMNRNGHLLNDRLFAFEYLFNNDGLTISISNMKDYEYILPLINGEVRIIKGSLKSKEKAFFLTPGFIYDNYVIEPDENGKLLIEVY